MIRQQRLQSVLTTWASLEAGFVEHRLCATVVDLLSVGGASVAVRIAGDSVTSLCASDPVAARIDELHLALGEGPGIDATTTGRPVVELDLTALREARWMAFATAAHRAGITGVVALPLRVESIRVGALSLYLTTLGALSADWFETAEIVASLTTHAVLSLQADTPPGMLADQLEQLARYRATIDQASGMVSAQLSVTVAEALAVLRARAFANNRSLPEMARSVTSGTIRFH